MNQREFDNILEECLSRVMRGEDIEAVLLAYPRYAAELEPLLKTALNARLAAAVKPRPEFRQRAAAEFQQAIQSMPVKETGGGFRWQAAWMAPLAAFIALVIAGGGVVAASGGSLPDSPLYSVKLAVESVQLAFTPSSQGKAELYAAFNDRRVDEIVKMAEKGDVREIEKLTATLASNMDAIDELTGGGGETAAAEFGVLMAPETEPLPPETEPLPPETTPDGFDTATQAGPEQTVTPAVTPPPAATQTTIARPEPTRPDVLPPSASPETGWKSVEPVEEGTRGRDTTENEELQRFLTEKQREALRKLYEQLERAPEWLKPSIQAAIDVILYGYDTSINNLAE